MTELLKNPTASDVADLILSITRLYSVKPAELKVRFQEADDGSAYFMIQPDPQDDSRMIGRQGCHITALDFLVSGVGRAQGRLFTTRLITSPQGGAAWVDQRDVIEYDPRPARELLARWLAALGVSDFEVDVGPGTGPRRSLFFNFEVKVPDREAIAKLTTPRGEAGLFLIGALGTLFRAIAKQNGLRFQITAVDSSAVRAS